MKIYNTLSRKKEEFKPVTEGKVNMYACGPTVYNYFHIGNGRTFLFFDVVRSYLEYKGYDVNFVQNITDIDDKIIAQAIADGISAEEVATKYADAFLEDSKALGIKPATEYAYATKYIGRMIGFIKQLEVKGFAYESKGDVYFRVSKLDTYGELSGRKLEDLQVGARIEENTNKETPYDFTLWKAAKPGEPKWKSPWGEGRPGWHTECVVMSLDKLGKTFDIHGGGTDLVFPHHENELAQAKAHTTQAMANYWMHVGFLNIEGEKMSKSLNNFFTARGILKKYDAEAIRFFFLSKHYRSPIDFSEEIVKESDVAIKNFYKTLESVNYLNIQNETDDLLGSEEEKEFIEAMDDDFNTAKAVAVLFKINKKITSFNTEPEKNKYAKLLVKLGNVLGFFCNLEEKLSIDLGPLSENLINLIISYRNEYRNDRNWQMADRLRDDLLELGIEILDSKDKSAWKIKK